MEIKQKIQQEIESEQDFDSEVEEKLENDEITIEEAGFLQGYEQSLEEE